MGTTRTFLIAFGTVAMAFGGGAAGALYFANGFNRPAQDHFSKMEEQRAEALKTVGETAVNPRPVVAPTNVLPQAAKNEPAYPVSATNPSLMVAAAQVPASTPTPAPSAPAASSPQASPATVTEPAPVVATKRAPAAAPVKTRVAVASVQKKRARVNREVRVGDVVDDRAMANAVPIEYREYDRGYRLSRPGDRRAFAIVGAD